MSGGASSGSGDSAFSRVGTSTGVSQRNLSQAQINQLNTQATNLSTQGGLMDQQKGYISNLLATTPSFSGQSTLNNVFSDQGAARLPLSSALTSMYGVDPYSSDYESGTQSEFDDRTQKMLASTVTGPSATSGGTASRGFQQAEVLRQAGLSRRSELQSQRTTDAGISTGAFAAADRWGSQKRQEVLSGLNMQNEFLQRYIPYQTQGAQIAAGNEAMLNQYLPILASLLSPQTTTQTDNLSGQGAQTSQATGFGVNLCCWIFLEAFRGKLPPHVRHCRDVFAPESSSRREGYRKMSNWLVPAMRKSKTVRWFVNALMVSPMEKWGGWYTKTPGYEYGFVYGPVKSFWFKLWELL